MASSSAADRNLLFGVLALQLDFITRDHLVGAMNAWVLDKNKSLGAILLEQKVLGADRHTLLQALVQEHLKQHQNDPQQSLAAVSAAGSVRKELEKIADADLQASMAQISTAGDAGDDPYATVAPTVGAPTSSGSRFRILRPHARGGIGEVFVAHDEELHREVALKEIQDNHADNQQSRARFMLEAEITGGLEHPGIVPVYGLGQYADGRPFYAMRFIRGDSLHDAIKRYHQSEPGASATGGSAPPTGECTLALRKLLGRFIDVCQAIQYAHDRGVLHRDLKPGNIMLGKYGETLVVDWGLAKAAGKFTAPGAAATGVSVDEPSLHPASGSGSAETLPGSALGTPAFMSPEQAAGRLDQLGPASDVYSLGATLYCLLTGKLPVEGQDLAQVLHNVKHGIFPRPRQLMPKIDPALEAICLKAMALRPEDRYQTPRQLREELEHWLGEEPVRAYPEPLARRLLRWSRRHKTFVTVSGTLVLMLTLFAAIFVFRRIDAYLHEQEEITAWENHPPFQMRDDSGNMKFNHGLHLALSEYTLGQIPERFRQRYRDRQQKKGDADPVQLNCGSCHQTDSNHFGINKADLKGLPLNSVFPARSSGQYMLPITYEIQCQACHPLEVKIKHHLTIPHRIGSEEVHALLTTFFAANMLEKKVVGTPEKKGNEPLFDFVKLDREAVRRNVHAVELELYRGKHSCMVCHVYDKNKSFAEESIQSGKAPMLTIAPTEIPQIWFENANFSHAAHHFTDCRTCHLQAAQSKKSSDILIPGIDTCRSCHTPSPRLEFAKSRAGFKCSECHTEGMLARLKRK